MNYVCKGSKIIRNIRKISILIRTFLASASKDAAICFVSEEQAQKKKLSLDLVLSKRMITFAPDDES